MFDTGRLHDVVLQSKTRTFTLGPLCEVADPSSYIGSRLQRHANMVDTNRCTRYFCLAKTWYWRTYATWPCESSASSAGNSSTRKRTITRRHGSGHKRSTHNARTSVACFGCPGKTTLPKPSFFSATALQRAF